MRNEIIVKKIIAYTDKVLNYCDGLTAEQFFADTKLVEACVFNLGQIGELANRIDDEYAKAHDNIPWRSIYNLRNRIVHDYEGVNLSLIWEIISSDLAPLKNDLLRLSNNIRKIGENVEKLGYCQSYRKSETQSTLKPIPARVIEGTLMKKRL